MHIAKRCLLVSELSCYKQTCARSHLQAGWWLDVAHLSASNPLTFGERGALAPLCEFNWRRHLPDTKARQLHGNTLRFVSSMKHGQGTTYENRWNKWPLLSEPQDVFEGAKFVIYQYRVRGCDDVQTVSSRLHC